MGSFRARHTRILVLLFLGLGACAGGGGLGSSCGGGCISPIPLPDGGIGNYQGPKTNNAVSLKVSKKGFDYLNSNWQTLLSQLTGNPIHIPVPCQHNTSVPLVGGAYICDQNQNGSCGAGEGCDGVNVTIQNFALAPKNAPSPGQSGLVTGTATLKIQTGDIKIRSDSTSWCDACFLGDDFVEGTINFDSTRSSPPSYTLSVDVNFTLDGRIDPLHPQLSFNASNIQGLETLDAADFDFSGDNCCGDIFFGAADLASSLSFITNFLIQQLVPLLQNQIDGLVNQQLCRPCGGAADPICPSAANGGQSSTCQSGKCMIAGDDQCVPRLLGLEGVIAPGTSLGKYGVPPDAALAISAAAGGSITSANNGGLSLGVIGGATSFSGPPPHLAPCVPDLPPPDGGAPAFPDFDSFSPDGGYHVGLGISDFFLNQAAYAAHRSGTMCLAISGNQIDILNTGLFKTFLPSLGLLAGSATQDAPMMVALRPLQAPTVDIGVGTYDPVTKKPIDPLITVNMNQVDLDIYARIEDRWSRLFTMTLDVKLPLSLIVDGCPQGITPAIGDLHNLITVSQAPSNSELLAEDPAVLQGLIPAVIGLAQPALASALQPIAVPSASGFTLHLDGLQGIGARDATTFESLGLFGEIRLAGQCDAASVHTEAQIVERFIPSAEQLRPQPGEQLPWPTATIAVSATGYEGDVEYDTRVDQGLWTTFKPGPTLTVTDPRLLIEGHHMIEVRGRPAHGMGVSDPAPVQLDFLVDWEAPTVRIAASETGMQVVATDNVDGPQALRYRYQVGGGAFTDWGSARPIDAQATSEAGSLTVEVQDEAGNVGSATWRGLTDVAPSAGATSKPGADLNSKHGGCGSVGGGSLLGLALLGLALVSRRRR